MMICQEIINQIKNTSNNAPILFTDIFTDEKSNEIYGVVVMLLDEMDFDTKKKIMVLVKFICKIEKKLE